MEDNIISPIKSKSSYYSSSENCKNDKKIENATYKVVITPTTLGLREILNAQGFF